MANLIIAFAGYTEKEVDDTPLTTYISWDRLKRVLEATAIDLDENEKITGFVIGGAGITVKLKTK